MTVHLVYTLYALGLRWLNGSTVLKREEGIYRLAKGKKKSGEIYLFLNDQWDEVCGATQNL